MSNFSTKLNLASLKHTRKLLKGQSGEIDCLIIPIDANNLYRGEKGLYLDLYHIQLKNPIEGQNTHLVKQNLPKELYEQMSEAERMAMPILGNSTVWVPQSNEAPLAEAIGEDDDLPF
ncbi:MAG: hypothetical protein KGZ87_05535 [Bacteroidetes bacterium]|nr:hypothetical protein [Bacteroidota bacterium]